MADTYTIGKQLVDLCAQGRNLEAINTLYADDIVSIEVTGMPEVGMPAEITGLDAIRGKNQWWMENHEVHRGECDGPYPHGDQFIVVFKYEVTPKQGPMSGQRMQMEEAGLYTVKDGKIVREQFFYHMG
ncbi:MAG: nuclear transport factor 2 family protein [Planctomycetes bacterium]|jgi:ketosteroid isomerase-like protein|nr:nuclear transport factor 2 family protein [Planctomycetota bacterium]